MTSIDDYFDRQEEKRQKERTLPINEMDDITPIYDTDGLPFEEEGVFNDISGMTAPPSTATIEKFLGTAFFPYDKLLETFGEYSIKTALQGGSNYEEALEDLIREQWGESYNKPFKFRKQPRSSKNRDRQAFQIAQALRRFYEAHQQSIDRRELKKKVQENDTPMPIQLAFKIFALEEIFDSETRNKDWFKGYLPFKTYEVIRKQAETALDKAGREYKEKTGQDPKYAEQQILRDEIELLRKGKFRTY